MPGAVEEAVDGQTVRRATPLVRVGRVRVAPAERVVDGLVHRLWRPVVRKERAGTALRVPVAGRVLHVNPGAVGAVVPMLENHLAAGVRIDAHPGPRRVLPPEPVVEAGTARAAGRVRVDVPHVPVLVARMAQPRGEPPLDVPEQPGVAAVAAVATAPPSH